MEAQYFAKLEEEVDKKEILYDEILLSDSEVQLINHNVLVHLAFVFAFSIRKLQTMISISSSKR